MLYNELMIKNSSKQTGSARLVIITVIVLVILGALGFVFWNNFIYKAPASKSNPAVVTKKEETQAQPFSIKEYGVQFMIPSALKDTTIKYESRQIGEASFLAFTTQRAINLGGDCSKGYPFGDLVMLSRDNQAKTNEYQVYTSEKVNGYYYHIGTVETSGLTPKSTCPANEQAKADEDALVDALKDLTLQD